MFVCVCVCVCVHTNTSTHAHTHAHAHTYTQVGMVVLQRRVKWRIDSIMSADQASIEFSTREHILYR